MKKFLLLATLATSSLLFAETPYQDLTNMQNHYYEKGYKEASKIYYRLGYEAAIKNSIKALEKYKTKIDAYEAGKYYSQSGKLTHPQMYRVKEGDNYVIRIERPELKERMTYRDILMIPEFNGDLLKDMNFEDEVGTNQINAFNNVTPIQAVNSPIADVRRFEVEFPKNDTVKAILAKNNKIFVSTPESYKVIFDDKRDYETFCKNVSGDAQCQRIR
ncbi:hypothetical protein [Campylobacter sp. JMF_03 NE3]|uniref:hypothetical protein n=1 Tax=Campylobacter sp. JMF_03 NE3 TaxID=2983831 RepID=UPI0022E9D19D|nr:hypothetical protein [Campylobacter sp. JMF_03 NE3]MDA3053283.1 hypothetical protein [Campylobacter sp. JMF_03 NE3]